MQSPRQVLALKKIILRLFNVQGKTDRKNFLDLEKIISPIKLGRTGDKASKIYKEISDEGNRRSY